MASSFTSRHRSEGFLGPVTYSRRALYRRPPKAYLRMQWIGPLLARLGLVPRSVIILEVPGRRSGRTRHTTLVRVALNGQRYLVALAGESEWVRNVRACGGHVVIGGRRRHAATLEEVPTEARPAVIQAYVWRGGRRPGSRSAAREARMYFGIPPHASLDEIAEVAGYYPVFRIAEHMARPATDGTGPG